MSYLIDPRLAAPNFLYKRSAAAVLIALVLLFSMSTLSAHAQSPYANDTPLSLVAAQALAVARSRQLTGQDYAASAARDRAVAAAQLPDPVLKVGIDNVPIGGQNRFSFSSEPMTMRRIGIMQELTSSDKRRLRAEGYERQAEQTLASKANMQAIIERDTALAWLERYYSQQIASALGQQADQARLQIQAAQASYRGGTGKQAEVYAARSELLEVDDRIDENQRRIANATTVLARWIGVDAERPLAALPSMDMVRLDPSQLEQQLSLHPQMDLLGQQQTLAETEAKLAQANQHADWSFDVNFQQRGASYGNMVSVGISIPLQWDQAQRQNRELASKLALVEQAKAERDEALREHVATTRSMMIDWRSLRERQSRYQNELLPLAKQQSLASLAAYRGGKASLTELLAAQRNEIDVQLRDLQLQMDAARLWAQLNYLSPQLSPNTAHNNAPMIAKDAP